MRKFYRLFYWVFFAGLVLGSYVNMFAVVFFISGLIFGSFYNVIAMRSTENRSWISGRSECDSCHHKLSWLDMIPVASYLLHNGKCRYCGKKIPIQHILAELGFGLVLLLVQPTTISLFIVLSVLWINCISDLTKKQTVTSINYLAMVGLIVLDITQANYINVFFSLVLIAAVWLLNYLFNKKDHAFDLGDVDILTVLTIYGGVWFAAKSLAIGCIVGMILLIPLLMTGKINRKTEIPLVPFIAMGSMILWLI